MSPIVLLFYFVLLGYSDAKNEGECDIVDITDTQWKIVFQLTIDDDKTNQVVYKSEYKGDLEITNCASDYFDISAKDNAFTISTTEKFDNFDLNTEKTNTSSTPLQNFQCHMKCKGGESSLDIVITVNDINTHPPTFKTLDHEYYVAAPLMPESDFSAFGSAVVATDIDFSNKMVTFTVDPDDFDVTTISTLDSKDYTAKFRAKNILQINGTKEYTITATDSGTNPGPLSTSQKFTLKSNTSASFDIPAFEAISYSFNYTESKGKCTLTPKDGGIITLTTNKPDDIAKHLTLIGDLEKHFEPIFDPTTKTVTISCLSPISTTLSVAILSLSVTTDSVASVPIVLYRGDPEAKGAEFSSHAYIADYDDKAKTVILKDDIVVTPSTALVYISGSTGGTDFTKYFSLEKKASNYEVKVKPLPDDFLKSQKSIVLTVTAELEDIKSYATLVINLPVVSTSPSAHFSQILYKGDYQVKDGKVNFTYVEINIDTEEDDQNVKVSISSDSPYRGYFNVSYASKKVMITVKSELPGEILNTVSVIPLTLIATVSGTDQSSAVFNVDIHYETEIAGRLNFNEPFYDGTYEVESDTLKVTEEITIDTDQTDDNIEVSINEEYKDYLNATYSGKKVTIVPLEHLPSTLKSMTVIPMILQAKIRSTGFSSQTVFNLRIINKKDETGSLEFSRVLYEGRYEVENDNFEVTDAITINTDQSDDNIEVSINDEYKDYLSANYSKKEVTIILSKPLPSSLTSMTVIPITLLAKIKSTKINSQAVFNLEIVAKKNETRYLIFRNLLYDGTYEVENDNFKVNEPITIDTDQTDDNIEVSINDKYKDYLSATYSKKEVTIVLSKPLPSTLTSMPVIPITLLAKIKSTGISSQALFNLIIIAKKDETRYLNFNNLLYDGTYEVENDNFKVNDVITINTDQTDDNIEVSINDEYKDYLSATYSKKEVTIVLSKPLPSTLSSMPVIPITLLAKIKSSGINSQAIFNLRIIAKKDETRYLNFNNLLYDGTYEVENDNFKVNDVITINTDQTDDNIEVSINDEYKDYLSATYSKKEVTIVLSKPLPSTLSSMPVIPITLLAKIKSTGINSQAVFNLRIIAKKDETRYLNFNNLLYDGTYEVENDNFKVNEAITINTDQTDDNIEVSINDEYKDYLSATYSKKKVTIVLSKHFPSTLTSMPVIPITLLAKIKSTGINSQAVFNLRIIAKKDETRYLNFKNLLYEGTYEVENDNFKVNDAITINTDQTDDNIEVSLNDEYKDYLSATYSKKEVTIVLLKPLPSTLTSMPVIPITLLAKIKSTGINSQAVFNLRIIAKKDETRYLNFNNLLYDGTYEVENDNFKVNEAITINTDQTDDNIEVSINDEYKDYLSATYSKKKVTIVLSKPFPYTLTSMPVIPITLLAEIKSTGINSQAVFNLKIIDKNVETRYLSFKNVLYNGSYEVENDNFKVNETITINTDQSDDNIEVSINDEYKDYLSANYSKKEVTIILSKPLPSSLTSMTVIPITLLAKIKSTGINSQAVFNLRIIGGYLSLSSFVYNGKYTVEDGKASIDKDTIKVETDQKEEKIDIEITNGYEKDFKATYSNKEVQITLSNESPSETLLKLANIPVGIKVRIKDTSVEATAVLNLRVIGAPDKNDTRTLAFSSVLYTGSYSVENDDEEGHFKIDDLELRTNLMDKEIEISLSNEYGYEKYFSVLNNNRIVSVKIKGGSLPDEVSKKIKFIPLTVSAKIIATGETSYAVLNINIDYIAEDGNKTKDHSVTGYIVAIVILTILLLALIGASVGFYFWKIRNKSYIKMDETGSNKVSFEQRHSKQSITEKRKASSALDERRPTGFVFRKFDESGAEIKEDGFGETNERRKSVAFDDNIEKLQIDAIDDDDIDKALSETEDANDTFNKDVKTSL